MPAVFLFSLVFFILSVSLIFYSYVIFPFILSVLIVKKKSRRRENFSQPLVSVLISVYNEEAVIGAKLESLLAQDYPSERREILVGSDASDDATENIVADYAKRFSSIKLFRFEGRIGKPSVINRLAEIAEGEILVLTDANVLFERNLLSNLIPNFGMSKTGLVGANILNIGLKEAGISKQEKSYVQRENQIKHREGELWGCMMGPFGGCYAVRKELYSPVPSGFLVDDFFICLRTIEKKFDCILDLNAICYEDVPDDPGQEFKRKARISSGNFQNLKVFRKLLLKPFSPPGFCFWSHKVLRWITPFLIIISIGTLSVLSFLNISFAILLLFEIILLLSPITDKALSRVGIHLKVLRFISYFSFMNLALLAGFLRYASGIRSGVWTPTKRK
jgi:cellulose synthase/poly-beta-1,6-N-acetylglucosamine synthase-like glycosyltransferase